MKKTTFYVIFILITISLVFSSAKPCCNKKAGKGAIACKVNQANIEDNKNIKQELVSNAPNQNNNALRCNTSNKNKQCNVNAKKSWWMFWKKKSNAECPCKKVQLNIDAVSTN